jgi:hypothetical protein
MEILANTRHERFARASAQGKTATEAYVLAATKPTTATRRTPLHAQPVGLPSKTGVSAFGALT